MAIVYGNVENIIWGEDGEFPFSAYIDRVKEEAKNMKSHFKIKICTKEEGQKEFIPKSLYIVNRNKDTTKLGEKTISKLNEVISNNFDGQVKIDFIHSSKPDIMLASFTRRLCIEQIQKKGKPMAYIDFDEMIFDENNKNSSLKNVIIRCIENAKEDGNRLRVEIRTKASGATSTRQEHCFSVDANEKYIELIMNSVSERLKSSPSEDFSGEIRLNFYAHGQASIKYGSFTRQIKQTSNKEKSTLFEYKTPIGFAEPERKPLNWPFNFEDDEYQTEMEEDYSYEDQYNDFYDFEDYENPNVIGSQKSLIEALAVAECLREENETLNRRIDTLLAIITNLTR
jgi:hypothetical protein